MEDQAIIRLFLDRSGDAIEKLSRKYGRLLHGIAANFLSDSRDIQECVNDTYLAVWNTIPPENPNPLSSYICRILRNIALKRRRSNTAQCRNNAYERSLDELAECIPDTALEDAIRSRELGRSINRFLDTLPKESRIIFLRRYWFGDSVKNIAALTGIKENAVSVRLSRTRNALAQHLNKEGYSL